MECRGTRATPPALASGGGKRGLVAERHRAPLWRDPNGCLTACPARSGFFGGGSGAQRIPAPFRVRVVMALVVRQRLGQLPGVGSPSDPKSRRSMCLRPNAHTERDQNRSAAGLATLAAALALGGAGRLSGAPEVARATAGTPPAPDAIPHEGRPRGPQAPGGL